MPRTVSAKPSGPLRPPNLPIPDKLKHDGGINDLMRSAIGTWAAKVWAIGMAWKSRLPWASRSRCRSNQRKVINDPVISEYINRLGRNLVRNSDSQVPFTIKVIDSDDINAFALPGGFFYVNSGLILAADEEAELAGVMAHEIGHVAACHAARENTRGNLMQMMTIPLIFIGGPIGYAG